MSACWPLLECLRQARCAHRKRRPGKRPEAYLTPYEMELVPMMLKELKHTAPRFFETVSFRWFKETVALNSARPGGAGNAQDNNNNITNQSDQQSEQKASASSSASSSAPLCNNNSLSVCPANPPITVNEFEAEGRALDDLIRLLAKTLMEKGTFDEEAEQHLASYRRKREQWRCTSAAAKASATLAAPTLLRTRSFSAAVAAPPISSGRLSGQTGRHGHGGAYDDPQQDEKRRGFFAWALTNRRSKAARQTDFLFMQLGEVLAHQFQCSVGVDKDGNVHERELKLLIWRHFVQMLVAVLTDRARFPG